MTKEEFLIYFDALRGAARPGSNAEGSMPPDKPAPKPCSLELPGNLIIDRRLKRSRKPPRCSSLGDCPEVRNPPAQSNG